MSKGAASCRPFLLSPKCRTRAGKVNQRLTNSGLYYFAMILDEMNAPLGQHRPAQPKRMTLPVTALIRCAVAALVVTAAGWIILGNEPGPDDPARESARISDPDSERVAKQSAAEEPKPEPARIETPPAMRTITIIDGTSGKRQEVVIPAPPEEEQAFDAPKSRTSLRLKAAERAGPFIPAQAGIQ
jgi:hypothetical protein